MNRESKKVGNDHVPSKRDSPTPRVALIVGGVVVAIWLAWFAGMFWFPAAGRSRESALISRCVCLRHSLTAHISASIALGWIRISQSVIVADFNERFRLQSVASHGKEFLDQPHLPT